MMESHYQAVKKVLKISEEFVKYYRIYQEDDFVWNYAYLLITMVPKSLNLLASYDKSLKLLLISELSPTEETFWQNKSKSGFMAILKSTMWKNVCEI